METAMPEANRWNHSAPRVELDHRARQARIQLDLIEQMIVLRPAAGSSLFRRILSHFSVAMVERRPQVFQTRGPLSNRRPPRRDLIRLGPVARFVFSRPQASVHNAIDPLKDRGKGTHAGCAAKCAARLRFGQDSLDFLYLDPVNLRNLCDLHPVPQPSADLGDVRCRNFARRGGFVAVAGRREYGAAFAGYRPCTSRNRWSCGPRRL